MLQNNWALLREAIGSVVVQFWVNDNINDFWKFNMIVSKVLDLHSEFGHRVTKQNFWNILVLKFRMHMSSFHCYQPSCIQSDVVTIWSSRHWLHEPVYKALDGITLVYLGAQQLWYRPVQGINVCGIKAFKQTWINHNVKVGSKGNRLMYVKIWSICMWWI